MLDGWRGSFLGCTRSSFSPFLPSFLRPHPPTTHAEATGIDLDEGDLPAFDPLPTRLPATLLALEDSGMVQDGEAGNYRVSRVLIFAWCLQRPGSTLSLNPAVFY